MYHHGLYVICSNLIYCILRDQIKQERERERESERERDRELGEEGEREEER